MKMSDIQVPDEHAKFIAKKVEQKLQTRPVTSTTKNKTTFKQWLEAISYCYKRESGDIEPKKIE